MKDSKTPSMTELLDFITGVMGQTRSEALKTDSCVFCQESCTPDTFRDPLSLKEFGISGLCQICQDETFTEEPEEPLDIDPRF